jgi:hypothetical protein
MIQTNETKEQRLARQRRQFNKLLREIKQSVASSYHLKAQHDAYYQNVKVIESVNLN